MWTAVHTQACSHTRAHTCACTRTHTHAHTHTTFVYNTYPSANLLQDVRTRLVSQCLKADVNFHVVTYVMYRNVVYSSVLYICGGGSKRARIATLPLVSRHCTVINRVVSYSRVQSSFYTVISSSLYAWLTRVYSMNSLYSNHLSQC